jgi:hypothetical protein
MGLSLSSGSQELSLQVPFCHVADTAFTSILLVISPEYLPGPRNMLVIAVLCEAVEAPPSHSPS